MISERSLTNAQKSLLKKGNKFAIAPSKIPVLNITSGVELGLSQVNFANKYSIDSARSKVITQCSSRPIVSFIGTATYQLAKFLKQILVPLVGNTRYTVKNSSEFVELI